MTLDDHRRGQRAFAEVAAEVAPPIHESRHLAPAGRPGGVDQLDQQIAADRFGQPGPLVLAPWRQNHVMQLDCGYGGIQHRAGSCRWLDRIGGRWGLQTQAAPWRERFIARRTGEIWSLDPGSYRTPPACAGGAEQGTP